jgi:hypothetical protein
MNITREQYNEAAYQVGRELLENALKRGESVPISLNYFSIHLRFSELVARKLFHDGPKTPAKVLSINQHPSYSEELQEQLEPLPNAGLRHAV